MSQVKLSMLRRPNQISDNVSMHVLPRLCTSEYLKPDSSGKQVFLYQPGKYKTRPFSPDYLYDVAIISGLTSVEIFSLPAKRWVESGNKRNSEFRGDLVLFPNRTHTFSTSIWRVIGNSSLKQAMNHGMNSARK